MHAVVIDRLEGDPAALAKAAASVLGVTPFDVRPSVTVPGGGPAILTVWADDARAEQTRHALERAGFDARVIPVEAIRSWFDVRGFEFGAEALRVEARRGEQIEVRYAEIEYLVRATAVSTLTTTKTVRETKFSPVRSILSGGLVNTKVEESKRTSKSTQSDEQLYVFWGNPRPLRMTEGSMIYQGLGAALQPSRNANFAHAVSELRRLCPRAGFDERLRKRIVQSQMLGRTLAADVYVDVAAWLIADSGTRGRAPFRNPG